MRVLYYRISLPYGPSWSKYDCPIKYYLNKYNLDSNIPTPKRLTKHEYVACFPEDVSYLFADILQNEEDCQVSFMKEEITFIENFRDVYVNELHEKVNGNNITEYFMVVGLTQLNI